MKSKIICCLSLMLLFCASCKKLSEDGTREGVIIEIPINVFDNNGKIIDESWKKYLKTKKPMGVIFFSDHLSNKEKSKKIITEIKDLVGEKMILSADEEGGRVNRIGWIDIDSAESIANKYQQIKKENGKQPAIDYVKNKYRPMFKEMQEIGLNTTIAPNLDLNKYGKIDRNSREYINYQICNNYIKLLSISNKKLSTQQLQQKKEAKLFLAYLEEANVRKLDVLGSKEERSREIRKLWNQLETEEKERLRLKFKDIAKYANYSFVVGDRSFGADPNLVGEIAEIFVDTAKEYGINCVMKHALGHGRVDGDTHLEKQHLNTSIEEILYDIQPYKKISYKVSFIMPSHIIYETIDKAYSAINSLKVLNFIRTTINKDAIFLTDDISMEGATNNIKSPCDLWIISHKTLEDIKEISKLNKLTKAQVDRIFNKFISN